MSYNGSGTFLINSTGQPVVANTVISATVFNALTSDLATGLSTAITKDGQTTITANIPFGNNKITGLAAGTAATDSATLGQVQSTAAKLITVTGTDTITGTMSPALTAYAAGQLFYFVSNAANTGAVTINIDGLGAKNITRDGATALAAGDINSGEFVVVIYDGTRFQMINAANSFGNTTINGTLTVTGNTALQANVSITSTLSVGGTFAVTGAATLGSTLAVTGKSDLPTVSTASINAAVALVTTGTVTNLTATGASIASANIGNLQFTAASIASINAGVAVITNLTATSASIASINAAVALVTTGTVTNLTATDVSAASAKFVQASITSANVGVALLTTATVTSLTATGASIASANIGNLQFTGASVASMNIGTAVITGLTVTNASIASMNAGTATITSGNLTFSSTAQRITGDMSNATIANRLFFQNSVTNGVSVFGVIPNGTATTSRVSVWNASDPANSSWGDISVTSAELQLRSNQVGTGTYLPMTFYTSGSERLRLDTSGNALLGTATGLAGSRLTVVGGGTQLSGGTTAQEGVRIQRATGYATFTGINNDNNAYNGLQFFTSASAAVTIDTSGNVGIGGTASAFDRVTVTGTLPSSSAFSIGFGSRGTIPSTSTSLAIGFSSVPGTQAASFTLSELAGFYAGQGTIGASSVVTSQYGFYVANTLTGATNNYGFYSNIASGSNRWNFYSAGSAQNYFAGNTLIGTTSNATGIVTRFLTKSSEAYASAAIFESDGSAANWARTDWKNVNIATPGIIYIDQGGEFAIRNEGNYAIAFFTNGSNERMRITGAGNIVAGASAALATTATNGFLYVPTCAGTPTGTPTAITGMAPIVVNTTNNKLYFYSGGAWRDAGP